jgi:SSS family solute:Na+ symporter
MGYVFIVLTLVATIISFIDHRGRVTREVVVNARSKKIIGVGWFFIVLGIICLIAGISLFKPFGYLGIESIFMLATLFVFFGLILILNMKMNYVHKKSYDTDPSIYKTSWIFNIGAIGIVIIIVLLYYFFW